MAETFRLSEEVTRLLADTVVEKEVMEPMAKIGWQEAVTPPSPDYSGQPAQPEGAPAPAPTPAGGTTPPAVGVPAGEQPKTAPTDDVIDLDQFKDPVTGKYFGKYPSKAEALKGVGHVVQMAKSAFTRNAELEAELKRVREGGSPSTPPVATPATGQPAIQEVSRLATEDLPKSPKLEKVLADLVENGGVLDADNMKALLDGISDHSQKVAERAAERVIETRESVVTKDKAEWDKVDEYMREHHPDALNFADEMGLMVQSNPLLSAGVAAMIARGDRIGAAVEMWKQYSASVNHQEAVAQRGAAETQETRLSAADAVRREAVDLARKDAGIVSSSAAGIHETPGGVGPTPEQVAQAGQEMRATGLGARWREMTIGRTLTGPLFDRP